MAERTDLLRVALAQINPTVGDIRGNARKIADAHRARPRRGRGARGVPRAGADRLPARGPAAEDELPRRRAHRAATSSPPRRGTSSRVVGFPEQAEDVYNTAAVLADGDVVAGYRKMYLPNYGVFDEQRYFQSGAEARDRRAERRSRSGISDLRGHLGARPAGDDRGARGRAGDREPVGLAVPRGLRRRAASGCSPSAPWTTSPPSCSCNTVGGQDELVFDGHSLAIDQDGARAGARAAVRGGAHALHDRPARGRRGAPARHAPPRERAPPAQGRARSRSRPCSRWRQPRDRGRRRAVGGVR